MSKNKKNKGKGKKRLAKVFLGVFLFFAVLFSALALWLGIFYFIKADKTDYVPENYSLHLRTDSVWKSVNPMVDLQAADVLLSDPSFSKYKPLLVDFRQSDLRNSKLFKVVLSRRADFMLYEDASFVAMVDSGFLSGIVRLAPAILKHLSIENLSVCNSSGRTWFEYVKGERTFYVQIIKNLIIISSDKTLFDYSVSGGHSEKIPDKHKKTFEGKLNSAFSITADSRKVLNIFAENNSYVKAVLNFIPEDEPSVIDFGITDSKLKVCVNFPYDITEMDLENPVGKLLKKNSKIPDIVQRFPSIVQYYTVLSAGSLSELKDAAFYAVDSKVGLEEKWQTAESLSNFVFNKSIEELLFSWTDDEYAVIGLEQKSDPVFIVKIKDEQNRRQIFETLFKSIILQNDTSLIMDNVRLPRIEVPPFFQAVLESFNISLPSPYYMIKDGYMYLSQSPENLAQINAALKNGARLSQDGNWKEISGSFNQYSSLSLYYNLERSIPFFINSKSAVSNVLKLYNIGRLDLRFKSEGIEVSLSSVEKKSNSVEVLTGFPVSFKKKIISDIYPSGKAGSKTVFFRHNGMLVSYNLETLESSTREISNVRFIASAKENIQNGKKSSSDSALWCVTGDGTVYLLNEKLEDCASFPLVTGIVPTSTGQAFGSRLEFAGKNQKSIVVYSDGKVIEQETTSFDNLTVVPVLHDKISMYYEKSFLGGIHILDSNGEKAFLQLEDIGFGSPDYIKGNDTIQIGFISQSGKLTKYDYVVSGKNENCYDAVSIDLDGVFYLNVKAIGNSFAALSEDGVLYSVNKDLTSVTKIKIPNLTAKTGYLSVADFDLDGKDEIFVCGEGNIIYGFRENLELIGCFPISGYGVPLFYDLDGDKKMECVCLSLDNTLNAWNLVY